VTQNLKLYLHIFNIKKWENKLKIMVIHKFVENS